MWFLAVGHLQHARGGPVPVVAPDGAGQSRGAERLLVLVARDGQHQSESFRILPGELTNLPGIFQQRHGSASGKVQQEQFAFVGPSAVVRAGADRQQRQGGMEGERVGGPTRSHLEQAGEIVGAVNRRPMPTRIRLRTARDVTTVPLWPEKRPADRDERSVGRGRGDARLADLAERAGTQHPVHPGFEHAHRIPAGSILLIMGRSCRRGPQMASHQMLLVAVREW